MVQRHLGFRLTFKNCRKEQHLWVSTTTRMVFTSTFEIIQVRPLLRSGKWSRISKSYHFYLTLNSTIMHGNLRHLLVCSSTTARYLFYPVDGYLPRKLPVNFTCTFCLDVCFCFCLFLFLFFCFGRFLLLHSSWMTSNFKMQCK